ncbi:MAG TPA: GGDEF domain-containing protein [Pseudorhodoferax sp.]|jgi:diguanylate cyclase (GGDEF)-like protein|nr:GGDEF domain-containing protein [Pseudorhodoferax sp.]
MNALDLRSLTLMACMTSAAMGFVLLMLRRHYPDSIRGMLLWGLAPVTGALSTVFFGLEGRLPALLVVVVGNGLLMVCCGLYYFGSQRFYAQRSHWRAWSAVGVLALLWQAFFLEVHPDYRMRLALFTATLSVLLLFHVRLLLRRGKGFAVRFTAGVLTVQVLVLLVRGVSTFWLDTPATDRFSPSPMQSLYLATYSFSVLLVSVGVLLMASERLRSEFEHMANHDSLTGALARRVVLQDGTLEFGRWQRYGHGFALLMVDVDCFKQINDQHGHAAGDRVLVQLVQALAHALRTVDRLGRYGGEEFLVLLPETGMDEARRVAERMRQAVAQRAATPAVPACTVSIGVAGVQRGDASLDAVLARADAALYEAKRLGRNRVEVAGG